MGLSKSEFRTLLELLNSTEEYELNCEQCLSLVAEFAEQRLAGRSIDDSLRVVEQHLSVCSECREEYEALRQSLESIDGGENVST